MLSKQDSLEFLWRDIVQFSSQKLLDLLLFHSHFQAHFGVGIGTEDDPFSWVAPNMIRSINCLSNNYIFRAIERA